MQPENFVESIKTYLKKSKLTRNSPKDKEDIKYIEVLLEKNSANK